MSEETYRVELYPAGHEPTIFVGCRVHGYSGTILTFHNKDGATIETSIPWLYMLEAKVTWRVDVLGSHSDAQPSEWIDWNDGDYEEESLAKFEYARACEHSGWEGARLVKITTTEEVITTHERKSE